MKRRWIGLDWLRVVSVLASFTGVAFAQANSLQTWNGSFTYQGGTYPFTMVGRSTSGLATSTKTPIAQPSRTSPSCPMKWVSGQTTPLSQTSRPAATYLTGIWRWEIHSSVITKLTLSMGLPIACRTWRFYTFSAEQRVSR